MAISVGAVGAMLAGDAKLTMPPVPTWYRGREQVAVYLGGGPLAGTRHWRLIPARANGQLAFGRYARDGTTQAFTPRAIAALEPAIAGISKELLDAAIPTGHMDFAADFSAPLAMRVIAGMIGIEPADWPRYRSWNDKILGLTTSNAAKSA